MSAAVQHILRQMQRDARLAWLIGPGSRTYELLTEEASTANGLNLEELRRQHGATLKFEAWPTALPTDADPSTWNQLSFTAQANALRYRGRRGIISAGVTGNAPVLEFWKGYTEATRDLISGVGGYASAKDARLPKGNLQTGLEAAVACLPEGTKRLTLAEVRQILAAHRIEIAADAVPHVDLSAGEVLEHNVVPRVDSDDEHPVARVHMRHGSDSHGLAFPNESEASLNHSASDQAVAQEGRQA